MLHRLFSADAEPYSVPRGDNLSVGRSFIDGAAWNASRRSPLRLEPMDNISSRCCSAELAHLNEFRTHYRCLGVRHYTMLSSDELPPASSTCSIYSLDATQTSQSENSEMMFRGVTMYWESSLLVTPGIRRACPHDHLCCTERTVHSVSETYNRLFSGFRLGL